MTTLRWEAVGANPLPGDPRAFGELAQSFSETAGNAGEARARLQRLAGAVDETIWRGGAADAFRSKVTELPPRLAKLSESYTAASEGLADYGRILGELQDRARTIQAEAEAAQADHDVQARQRDESQARDPVAPTTHYAAAIADAQKRLGDARNRMDDLLDQRRAAERAAIAKLERAHDLGIRNDPWYKRAWRSLEEWVDDHADLLWDISGALKAVSAVAGLLSFIPVLAPVCAPIALAAGAAALVLDGVLCATGNGDWKALAVDGALMALPGAGRLASQGIKALRGVRAAEAAGETGLAVDRLAVAADKTVDVGRITPEPVWRTTDEPLFRLDNRPQSKIFEEGFRPLGDKTDLLDFTQTNRDSVFVSTSTADDLYKHPDWSGTRFQYEVRAPGGIDVNATLPDNVFAHEREIAVPGGIDRSVIRGGWDLVRDADGAVRRGQWVANPHYAGRS